MVQNGQNFKFNHVMFESPLFVKIKSQDREDFTQQLIIKIALHAQSTSSQQQILCFELTEDSNPFFYYYLNCSESDFHVVKQEQQFLFDFQKFPGYIIQHLESCMASYTQAE